MKTCALFCGGYSSEFDISLKSAQNICTHFPKEFEIVKVVVQKKSWTVFFNDQEFDFCFDNPGFVIKNSHKKFDFAFVFIHGNPGENGKLQGYLDLFGIPYINCSPLSSSISFDKWFCNNYLKALGIMVAKSLSLQKTTPYFVDDIVEQLGLPIFVKPSDSGSSYGISKVKEKKDFASAIEMAFKEGDTVILESFLNGREVTCAVYQNENGIQTLPLTEIVSENEFFDFDAKYNGKSEEITPARISPTQQSMIQSLATKIYGLLQLRGFIRIDFMLVDNTAYVIEVNTIPGFSNESIVPKMLKEAKIEPETFLREIIDYELILRHRV